MLCGCVREGVGVFQVQGRMGMSGLAKEPNHISRDRGLGGGGAHLEARKGLFSDPVS